MVLILFEFSFLIAEIRDALAFHGCLTSFGTILSATCGLFEVSEF